MSWPGTWQDAVIGAVGWCFALALLPMLRRGAPKPPVLTSLCNAGLLLILAGTVGSLGQYFGACSMAATGGTWAWIDARGANERRGRG